MMYAIYWPELILQKLIIKELISVQLIIDFRRNLQFLEVELVFLSAKGIKITQCITRHSQLVLDLSFYRFPQDSNY